MRWAMKHIGKMFMFSSVEGEFIDFELVKWNVSMFHTYLTYILEISIPQNLAKLGVALKWSSADLG